MRNGLKLVVVMVPLIALGAAYLGYPIKTKAPPTQAAPGERATAVRVVGARPGAVAPVIRGWGLVSPAETFEAIAQVSGTVAWANPALQRGAALPAGAPCGRDRGPKAGPSRRAGPAPRCGSHASAPARLGMCPLRLRPFRRN